MIGHYLSSNNEMCYSTKIQTFSRTKRSLILKTKAQRKPFLQKGPWGTMKIEQGPYRYYSSSSLEDASSLKKRRHRKSTMR